MHGFYPLLPRNASIRACGYPTRLMGFMRNARVQHMPPTRGHIGSLRRHPICVPPGRARYIFCTTTCNCSFFFPIDPSPNPSGSALPLPHPLTLRILNPCIPSSLQVYIFNLTATMAAALRSHPWHDLPAGEKCPDCVNAYVAFPAASATNGRSLVQSRCYSLFDYLLF